MRSSVHTSCNAQKQFPLLTAASTHILTFQTNLFLMLIRKKHLRLETLHREWSRKYQVATAITATWIFHANRDHVLVSTKYYHTTTFTQKSSLQGRIAELCWYWQYLKHQQKLYYQVEFHPQPHLSTIPKLVHLNRPVLKTAECSHYWDTSQILHKKLKSLHRPCVKTRHLLCSYRLYLLPLATKLRLPKKNESRKNATAFLRCIISNARERLLACCTSEHNLWNT